MRKNYDYKKLEPSFSKPYLNSIARIIKIAAKADEKREKGVFLYPSFILFKIEKIRYKLESRWFRRRRN